MVHLYGTISTTNVKVDTPEVEIGEGQQRSDIRKGPGETELTVVVGIMHLIK